MRCVIGARGSVAISIAAALWMSPAASWSQGFPVKPVRYVVPFGPGGSPDLVARLLGERLSRLWGQQVVVENRVGAAGLLGTAFVAKSPPDGYTLVQCNVASSGIAVSLNAKMPHPCGHRALGAHHQGGEDSAAVAEIRARLDF